MGIKTGNLGFGYDLNGNMVTDGTRAATLTYNYLNLPQTVTIAGKTQTYDYDATGVKHKYVADTLILKYAGIFEYRKVGNNDKLYRINLSEGQAVYRNGKLDFDYYLKDHLGNTRVVFDGKGNILQKTDYYPFGLAIARDVPAQTAVVRNAVNRYHFLGKERQVGTGYIDLQARFYDPGIGRFLQVDPMAEMFESLSPYNYAENNPITNIDPDGMASFGVNGSSEDETAKRGAGFGGMDNQVIGDCPSCPKDKSYDIYRKSDALFTYDNKTGIVVNGDGTGPTIYGKSNSQEATTIGLPWWYGLGAFAENAPQISLNGLKAAATIPLMTLAFVLSPTPAGQGSTVNPAIVYHKMPPKVLPGFPGAKKVPSKNQRTRWVTPDGKILEWDYQHGDVEVYDKRGNHKGSADPNSGRMTKDPVPGRKTNN